jgi:hypothetical protein
MRKGCECDCYQTTEGVRDLICKHCGHTPMTHLLVPTCCVEADVHGPITRQLLRDIFHNRSDAPTKPKLELGPLLATVVGEQAMNVEAFSPETRPPSRSRLDGADDASTAIDAPFEPSYQEPAEVNDDVCIKRPAKREDFDPNRRSGEVPRAELQALQLVQKQESPGRHHLESISVAKEEEEALWIEHFEGKLQRQDQLRKGFNLTRPIPMILDDELRISTDPTEVYLELLDRFGKEDLNLRENEDTGFVSLCFRNDVFLERHWKKILRDVRSVTQCCE